jgi:glycosyltransferase 2 family protein
MLAWPVRETEIVLEPGTQPARPLRRRVVLAVRILAVIAIGYFVVATTISQWQDVQETFRSLSWPTVLLSTVAALLGIATTALSWRAALADLGHPVPVTSAAQVLLVGQLGKYLPGSVWSYVMQMELGKRAGIPRTRVFLASLVMTGLGITTGLAIGALGLPGTLRASHASQYAGTARVAFWVTLILLPVALACAHPRVLTRLVQLVLRLFRREPLDTPLTWRGVLGTMAWSAVGYACFGVHLWLLARTQATPGIAGLGTCVVTIALAIAVSTVVVIAPSGIGVREFLVAIALVGFGVPFGTAYGIALASRLIATVGDVVAAGAAAVTGLRRIRRSA